MVVYMYRDENRKLLMCISFLLLLQQQQHQTSKHHNMIKKGDERFSLKSVKSKESIQRYRHGDDSKSSDHDGRDDTYGRSSYQGKYQTIVKHSP